MDKISLNKTNKLLYIFLSSSIFLGFYFGEDSSGSGGFIADFNNTLKYLDNLNLGFKEYFQEGVAHFPLHYYLESKILNIVHNLDVLRLVYVFISLCIPILFYRSLKIKFESIDRNNLFIFSLIIFLMPSFRSGAIWANSQLTALLFFLIALFYFCKWEKQKDFARLNTNLFLQILFLSLAVYARQLYAIVFLYMVYLYYLRLNFKTFFLVCSVILIVSLPGFYFISLLPSTLTLTFTSQIHNSIVVNLSILSFYLIPIYFFLFADQKLNFISFNKNKIFLFFVSSLILFLFCFWFSYNFKLGGGFFIKLSVILFDNLYFFYLTSFMGLLFCFMICFENKENIIILFLLVTGISSYQIFQKYFEPMFLMIFFILMKTKISEIFLSKKKYIYFLSAYFLFYLCAAILNDFLKLTKNL